MAFSLLAYPKLQRAFGTLPVARAGLLLAVVVAIAIPCVRFAVPESPIQHFPRHFADSSSSVGALAASDTRQQPLSHFTGNSSSSNGDAGPYATFNSSSSIGMLAWALFYFTMLLKAVSGCSAFTSSMILVNALPPPQQLGQVNGVGQSLASLARGLGPGLGGVLWGASVRFHRPGAALLPYGLVALTALGGWCIYWFVHMPEGIEVSRGVESSSSSSGEGSKEGQERGGIVGSSCCQE
jgi:hypothetical protein